jgi:hypothetical protein
MPDITLSRGSLTIDGKTFKVKRIGKGSFATAYADAKNNVFLFIKDDSGDYAKEILSNIQEGNPHIPYTVALGHTRTEKVYGMKLYKAPLRKADSAKAWAQYQVLRKCWNTARDEVQRRAGRRDLVHYGYQIADETIACAEMQPKRIMTPRLLEALELMAGDMANYGTEWTFEFSPRNLATDGRGRLVLLDIMFSIAAMKRKRRW